MLLKTLFLPAQLFSLGRVIEVYMERRKLLFIDDQALTCKYFAKIMQTDFDVTIATTIEDGLAFINCSKKYEIIISDYRFENHDGDTCGIDLLKAVDPSSSSMLAICSAYSSVPNILKDQSLDNIKFLDKPINYEKLRRMIDNHFGLFSLLST
jgi:DNA-binding NtrC family response regulator